MDLEQ